jgi:hypothetical protein
MQAYFESNPDYDGVWAKKVSTNLNRIYALAGIKALKSGLTERWWGKAIFLALDRIAADRQWSKPWPRSDICLTALQDEHVFELTAVPIDDGMMAARDIVDMYVDAGGPDRFRSAASGASSTPAATTVDEIDEEKEILPVVRVFELASRQVRDRKLISRVRRLYNDRCAVCGKALALTGAANTYSEVGHVKPVGFPINGPDHISNMLPFCPNHHRQFDRGAVYIEVKGGVATVMDRTHRPSLRKRTFKPAAGHAFDMSNLEWHAEFFLQR